MIERLEILQVKCLLAHAGYVKNASSETIRHMPIHLKFVLPTWKLAVQEKTGRQLASGHAIGKDARKPRSKHCLQRCWVERDLTFDLQTQAQGIVLDHDFPGLQWNCHVPTGHGGKAENKRFELELGVATASA